MDGIKPELWDRHARACADLRNAEEDLHAAMAQLRSAVAAYVRVEAEVSGDRAIEALLGIASSGRSTWGGGPTSENNIIEYLKRDEAVALLNRNYRRPS